MESMQEAQRLLVLVNARAAELEDLGFGSDHGSGIKLGEPWVEVRAFLKRIAEGDVPEITDERLADLLMKEAKTETKTLRAMVQNAAFSAEDHRLSAFNYATRAAELRAVLAAREIGEVQL